MTMAGPGKVYLVGAGPGDPKLLTLRGLECLQRAEVVVYDRLVDPALLLYAPPQAECIYAGKERGHHTLPQEEINALLIHRARQGKLVVRLKGGDPYVFGRGGEEAEALAAAGIPFEVVPGVSSAIAVPAAAGIPVTHRALTSSFTVVSGHEGAGSAMPELDWPALARSGGTLIFLMGVTNLPEIVTRLVAHGRSPRTPVALVRWGTWPEQETLSGTLADIIERATARRFGPPAVIVVGEVAALRERLDRTEQRELFGYRVVIPFTEPLPAGLVETLEDAGAHVLAVLLPEATSRTKDAIPPVCAVGQQCYPVAQASRLCEVLERYPRTVVVLPAPAVARALAAAPGLAAIAPERLVVVCLGADTAEEARRTGLPVRCWVSSSTGLVQTLCATGYPRDLLDLAAR
jgi:uroporphyrin-III C-methyltransferase